MVLKFSFPYNQSYDNDDAVIGLWKTLLDSGKDLGIAPIGLGARDTLRMEANMNLYGNDMDDQTSPYESGLGWSVKLKKRNHLLERMPVRNPKAINGRNDRLI